jgi:hypothetical protein
MLILFFCYSALILCWFVETVHWDERLHSSMAFCVTFASRHRSKTDIYVLPQLSFRNETNISNDFNFYILLCYTFL